MVGAWATSFKYRLRGVTRLVTPLEALRRFPVYCVSRRYKFLAKGLLFSCFGDVIVVVVVWWFGGFPLSPVFSSEFLGVL